MEATANVIDVTNFEEEVLNASRKRPVLVDFWAAWCGPCRMLGPVLEKVAREADGAWTLAKVNTEEHPQAASRYGVRGIPNVKLFVDGEPIAEFTGALPEHAVRKWLEEELPTEEKARLEELRTLVRKGKKEEARSGLETLLEEQPGHDEARILLARLLVWDDPARAHEIAQESDFVDAQAEEVKEDIATIAHLAELHEDPSRLPDGPAQQEYGIAIDALDKENLDTALEQFIEVIQKDRGYDDDGARRACLAIFRLLGEDHPVVKRHRPQFNMALY